MDASHGVTESGPKLRFDVRGDPESDPQAAKRAHAHAVTGIVYANALGQKVDGLLRGLNVDQGAITYATDMIERMAPRDPAEEMLVVQMILAHVRTLHLTSKATEQRRLDSLRIVNEYVDRASNTYRRLMLALSEYRPPRRSPNVTSIGQANIADKQVVWNGRGDCENSTNEQGSDSSCGETPLPPLGSGAGGPESLGETSPAVAVRDRPPNSGRQGAQQNERVETR